MAFLRIFNILEKQTQTKYNCETTKRIIHSFFEWETADKITHTGQKWNGDDYRLVRFLGKSKEINPNWAINLIAEVPPIPVNERVVSCDGGNGPKGHPKVFINLDKPGNHSCLYCGLRFFKNKCP